MIRVETAGIALTAEEILMKRKMWIGALGLVAVLVAGGLLASNMGFKLNYTLNGPGVNGSATGTATLAMPYNQQTNLVDAEDLIGDINAGAGSSVVSSVSRYVKQTDGLETYTGAAGVNFALVPGDSYLAQVSASTNYIMVGSHDPSLAIALDGPGTNGSATGTSAWSYPYHGTAVDAESLIDEINLAAGSSAVTSVSRYLGGSDGLETYTGAAGVNFALAPGEGYFIQVASDVSWVPSHY